MTTPAAVFNETGYYHAKQVFAADEIAALDDAFDKIVRQLTASGEPIDATWAGPEMEQHGSSSNLVVHTHNVQQYSAVWHRAFLQNGFLDAAEELLGPDIVLHHSKLFQKPPEVGSPFPMHQDWTYFPTEKDTMIAAVIHVSDATDAMGCLRVYPGSHRVGRVAGSSGQAPSEFLEQYPLEQATVVEAEAGDVVFFHYFTLHGSMPNRSRQTRKTVLAQLHAGNDRVEEGNAHPDERLVLRGWNHHATRSRSNRTMP